MFLYVLGDSYCERLAGAMSHDDAHFMDQALTLARRALGRTAPNPAVGAVIVNAGEVVGTGCTKPAGESHAEVIALAGAGTRAAGGTLYVTLEPCCHFGQTPPCTDAIVAAGITRCVVAVADPFLLVNGGGIAQLRKAGIAVDLGLREHEAAALNAGFFTRVRTGRPLVIVKYAMTLDGRSATRTGQSQWITGEAARQMVHQQRDRVDAIMIGSGTVSVDNPALTTRMPHASAGDGGPHHPVRVVVDGRGSSPLTAQIFDPALPGTTMLATTSAVPAEWLASIAKRGIEPIMCGDGPSVDLGLLLDLLGERGINTLIVEGGSRLHGALFDAGLVDRVAAFIAPVLVGGSDALGPVGGRGVTSMADAVRLKNVQLQRYGDDMLIEGDVVASHERRVG